MMRRSNWQTTGGPRACTTAGHAARWRMILAAPECRPRRDHTPFPEPEDSMKTSQNDPRFGPERSSRLSCVVACLGWAAGAAAGEPRDSSRKLTPAERMAPSRLKAAHEDVARIKRLRRDIPLRPGLNDYRAILHAHAEDSSHTGGTRPEMLAEAKRAGVHAILLTDHHRPPRDFIDRRAGAGCGTACCSCPGRRIAGSCSIRRARSWTTWTDPRPAFIEAVRADGGLIFLSHIEERPEHPMDGLDGMEIYNRHADAKKDAAGLLALSPEADRPGPAPRARAGLRDLPGRAVRRTGGVPRRLPGQMGPGDQARGG